MAAFRKRRYERLGQFWDDVRSVWRMRGEVAGILRGKSLSPAFRERLMLAVTGVNACRYCTFVHTRAALHSGVAKSELAGLSAGTFDGAPEEECAALVYAQHWADTKKCPDPEAVERLNATYGPEVAARINATISFIYLNNLCGNTFDWLLYKVTFGLVGGS